MGPSTRYFAHRGNIDTNIGCLGMGNSYSGRFFQHVVLKQMSLFRGFERLVRIKVKGRSRIWHQMGGNPLPTAFFELFPAAAETRFVPAHL